MGGDPTEIVRRCFQAYIDSDRAAIEAVIADDFYCAKRKDGGGGSLFRMVGTQ